MPTTNEAKEKELESDSMGEQRVESEESISMSGVVTVVSSRMALKGLTSVSYGAEVLLGRELLGYTHRLLQNTHNEKVAPALVLVERHLADLHGVILNHTTSLLHPVKTGILESKRVRVLKAKLTRALEYAEGMAMQGGDYVMERDLVLLPVDIGKFFAIAVGLKEKDEGYGYVVDHVSRLLSSIFDVVKVVGWSEAKMEKAECTSAEEERTATAQPSQPQP